MKINAFDELIRSKLSQIEPEFNAQSWDLLESKMDALSPETDNINVSDALKFDQIISGKINGFKPEVPASSWKVFENILEQSELASQQNARVFDGYIVEKLNNYKVPYNALSWNNLSERLDYLLNLKKNFFRLKLAEASFLLLLLLLFYQNFPLWKNDLLKSEPAPAKDFATPQQPIAGNMNPTISESSPFKSDPDTLDENQSLNSISNYKKDQSANFQQERSLPISETEVGKEMAPIRNTFLSIPKIPSLTVSNISSSNASLSTPINEPSESVLLSEYSQDPIEVASILKMPLRDSAFSSYYAPSVLKEIKSVRKKKTWVGSVVGSVDFNRIITPPNFEERRFKEFDRYALGYSSGFTIGRETGRWQIESGLIYSTKFYNPPAVLFIIGGNIEDGYLAQGLKYFELDMVNIPLNFKYNFFQKRKWRVYALMGASLNIAFETNYYSTTQDGFRSGSFALAPAPQPGRVVNGLRSSDIEEKIFEGWLEGGPFVENSYLTLNIGAGIERALTSKFSTFIEPIYFYSFDYFGTFIDNRIGPDKDKIHNMSFQSGIRVRITN